MNDELNALAAEYNRIMIEPEAVESSYFQSVLSFYAYKKIGKPHLYNIRPFEIQRAGFKIGRELKKLPKNIKHTHIYYFDTNDKIILIESYGQTEAIIDREYFFYPENGVKSIYFTSGTKQVRNIHFSSVKNDRFLKSVNYGKYGSSISNYFYQENVLTQINVTQKEHNTKGISSYSTYFEYNKGKLERIVNKHSNGYEEQCYP
jgi:hypothetical protein